jgi:hypothetical protein
VKNENKSGGDKGDEKAKKENRKSAKSMKAKPGEEMKRSIGESPANIESESVSGYAKMYRRESERKWKMAARRRKYRISGGEEMKAAGGVAGSAKKHNGIRNRRNGEAKSNNESQRMAALNNGASCGVENGDVMQSERQI